MTLQNPKALFDAVRRIKGEPLTQDDVDSLNQAIRDALDGTIVVAASTGRRVSPEGIALIHSFESCRLDAYPDPGSKDGHPWTIGWGSTGEGIARGVRWTQEQADARFENDLTKFSGQVEKLLGDAPTTQRQFDALVSLAYNIGVGALAGSTVLRRHKAGDYKGAAQAFGMWVKNDGATMKGLVRRRAAEAAHYGGSA